MCSGKKGTLRQAWEHRDVDPWASHGMYPADVVSVHTHITNRATVEDRVIFYPLWNGSKAKTTYRCRRYGKCRGATRDINLPLLLNRESLADFLQLFYMLRIALDTLLHHCKVHQCIKRCNCAIDGAVAPSMATGVGSAVQNWQIVTVQIKTCKAKIQTCRNVLFCLWQVRMQWCFYFVVFMK